MSLRLFNQDYDYARRDKVQILMKLLPWYKGTRKEI